MLDVSPGSNPFSSATAPAQVLPLLDPTTLNFDTGLRVLNRTTRCVVPIPALPEGGEELIYPPGSERAGQPIKALENGDADRGIVFFNATDKVWQAVRGNGFEAILINDVSRAQGEKLTEKLNWLVSHSEPGPLRYATLLEFARNELNAVDYYPKKIDAVNREMEIVDPGLPLFMRVNKDTVHSAVYVTHGFVIEGPVTQIYPEGAVVLNDGKRSWGIDAGVFQRNFKVALDDGEDRALGDLTKEFGSRIVSEYAAKQVN